ncbi:hypothetical protein HNO89_001374 [Sporosarcina luteola]|nr:hypothetical protein [Sporosarcina luteola]
MNDKLKQYIRLNGGVLGGTLLFLQSMDIELVHFKEETIQVFTDMLLSFVPLALVAYGIKKFNIKLQVKKAGIQNGNERG